MRLWTRDVRDAADHVEVVPVQVPVEDGAHLAAAPRGCLRSSSPLAHERRGAALPSNQRLSRQILLGGAVVHEHDGRARRSPRDRPRATRAARRRCETSMILALARVQDDEVKAAAIERVVELRPSSRPRIAAEIGLAEVDRVVVAGDVDELGLAPRRMPGTRRSARDRPRGSRPRCRRRG